ncbi:ATP/GTP-binding protein [Streptomyces sp. NBC_01549]|uniref:ATP/GTP-binding protein n=1 Tax=unclassified Streptomyces TaxID=2593676 RepID=UPI00224EBAD4|nr:ATP/GTP-binding protein [Streptomyces sp. NBC_01549]MCX4596818.1 ATP/GTP-binding protein [Streptomyces sp. NBC_01549]
MLRRLAATAGSALLLLGSAHATARAADDPHVGAGECEIVRFCVNVHTDPKPGSQGNTSGKPAKGGKGIPAAAQPCTVSKLDPQPPAGSALWEGHDPSEGAIYVRVCPALQAAAGVAGVGTAIAGPQVFWAAQAPAANVDPAQLAQEALDKMTLLGPDIGITPKPGGKGVVGMPVYMWTARTAETYGPNSASASAGGVTVTATAKVKRIVWDMGDGNTVTCTTAGTPYKAAFGKKASPDCGYRYDEPSSTQAGGRYHVTATSTWQVDWQVNGGGETGQLAATRTNAVDIDVAEVQVLN